LADSGECAVGCDKQPDATSPAKGRAACQATGARSLELPEVVIALSKR
jgi:hypothetical protein